MKRRTLWRVAAIPLLVLVLLLGVSQVALAGWSWCSDPVIDIDGNIMNVQVDLSGDDDSSIPRGSKIQVWVAVPKDADATVLSESEIVTPDGKTISTQTRVMSVGWLEKSDGQIPVQVTVLVPGHGFNVVATVFTAQESVVQGGVAGERITIPFVINY